MAIRMMVSEVPDGAATMKGDPSWSTLDANDVKRWQIDPENHIWQTSWRGCVIATRERNYHDDSDFYAIVWDAEDGQPRTIEYATTRFWTYPSTATVDATDEVKAAYQAWCDAQSAQRAQEEAAIAAATPEKGKEVRITRGRKAKGQTGTVIWKGVDRYKSTRYTTAYRVGVKIDGQPEAVFVPEDYVEVIEQEMANA